MTAVTPDGSVSSLFDQELESLTWDENVAKCEAFEDCQRDAAWMGISPCACRLMECDPHKRAAEADLAMAERAGQTAYCDICNTQGMNPSAIRFVAI